MAASRVQLDLARLERGGKRLLEDVQLEIGAGEIVGIEGPNAVGKSTLLAATGLRIPVVGRRCLFGIDTAGLGSAGLTALRRRIGQQLQHFPLQHDLSVEESLAFAARIRCETGMIRSAVSRVLAGFDLAGRRRELVRKLNGGARARLSLATATVGLADGGLVLADEPTAGIDPAGAAEIMQIMHDLRFLHGHSIVVVAHDHRWLSRTADRLVRVDSGRLVGDRPRDVGTLHTRCAMPFQAWRIKSLWSHSNCFEVPGGAIDAVFSTGDSVKPCHPGNPDQAGESHVTVGANTVCGPAIPAIENGDHTVNLTMELCEGGI